MSVVQNPLFLKRARTFESDFACAPTAVARSAEGKLVAWESWQWPESWKAQFERLNIRSFANLFSPGLWKIETTFLTWKKHFPNGYCYLHGFEKNHLWKWKRSLACHNFFFPGPWKAVWERDQVTNPNSKDPMKHTSVVFTSQALGIPCAEIRIRSTTSNGHGSTCQVFDFHNKVICQIVLPRPSKNNCFWTAVKKLIGHPICFLMETYTQHKNCERFAL